MPGDMDVTPEGDQPEPTVPQRILVIDDEPSIGISVERALISQNYQVDIHQQAVEGLQAALTGHYDVVLLDLMMPDIDGIDVLRQIRASSVPSEVIMITGYATVDSAVKAMKEGAADYLSKPFSPDQLRLVIEKVAARSALIRENEALRRELQIQQGFEGMIGDSPPMRRVFSLIKRVAPTDGTVLVIGESGTGKEMVVGAVHRLSRRRQHPLMAFDCTALSPSLIESELFGHVKGSFSGALATKQGLFEVADKGTLFLDEVGNLSLETQAKLLRVLETRKVKKVGGTDEQEVDIRLVAATNRDLAELVREGHFRQDLYYRFNVVPIYIPPLRGRPGDVATLAMAFLAHFCDRHKLSIAGFTPEAMSRLERYHWPGNVRELRNIVERVAILCEGDRIEPRHLPPEIHGALPLPTAAITQLPARWDAFRQLKQEVRDTAVNALERRFLAEALSRNDDNVSRAADDVGMQRTNFHALMRKHGLTSNPGDRES